MGNFEIKKELTTRAVELIKEFRNEGILICGENILESISVNDTFDVITVKTIYEDEAIEYDLSDISSVFSLEMDGWGPCSPSFYEGFELAIAEAEYEYKKRDKDDFVKYIGGLCYMKYRCEEIYEELKVIEKKAKVLD